MKVDLHSHSHFSDGKHAPSFLLEQARRNQLTHLAITDHDCTQAYSTLNDLDRQTGLKLITGVEISSQWQDLEIHVVGLGISLENAALNQLLARQQLSRRQRLAKIDRALQALGIKGLQAYLEALPCIAQTRSHAADFLVSRAICKDRTKAFKQYLGRGGRVFQKSQWFSIDETVQAINDAGGIAILAHPSKYKFTNTKLKSLLTDFSQAGGEAMEVGYANIDSTITARLAQLCDTFELWASCGSDFHDAGASWTDIGKFVPLPAPSIKNAIWLHPRWHSLAGFDC